MSTNHRSVTDLYYPSFGLATALHRRGNTFYIVFPRAYGMALGNKLVARLNFPRPNDPSPDPPASHPNLNCRFWHRSGSNTEQMMMPFEDLMSIEPQAFKDTGLRRLVTVTADSEKGGKEDEERLVEVLLREEEYCQRCAWCGGWEYSYDYSTRHVKVKEGKSIYWCGSCIRMPKLWSRYWWQDPEKLSDSVYFFCQLP